MSRLDEEGDFVETFIPFRNLLPETKDIPDAVFTYFSNQIKNFDGFIKRLKVYDAIKQKDHITHYENVDREKYIEILRNEFRLILR